MTLTRTTVETADEQAASSDATRNRAEILASHLEELGIGVSIEGSTRELPPSIDAGDYILELDEWERTAVKAYASGVDARGRPWPSLIIEGLGYQVRCLERAAAIDGTSVPRPDRRAELIDELIIDGTIGLTLLDDLQWAINRLIREGEVRVAGRLTDFRNAVNQNVSRVRSFVGNATFARSESAARESSDGQIQQRWPDIAIGLDDDSEPPRPVQPHRVLPQPKAREQAAVRVPTLRRAERPSPSRVLPLTIVLVVSVMVWFFAAPRPAEPELLPRLTENDFAHVPSVSKIEARPPSLYVTMSALRWREINDLERWQVLEQIGTIAGRADYVGVHVRTSDGETVGQWSKFNGSRVIKPPRGAS